MGIEKKFGALKTTALTAATFGSTFGACKGIWMMSDGLFYTQDKFHSLEFYCGAAAFFLGGSLAMYFADGLREKIYNCPSIGGSS